MRNCLTKVKVILVRVYLLYVYENETKYQKYPNTTSSLIVDEATHEPKEREGLGIPKKSRKSRGGCPERIVGTRSARRTLRYTTSACWLKNLPYDMYDMCDI